MTSRHFDPDWRDSWKTPAIKDAEAAMEAAARQADKVLSDARKLYVPPPRPLSDDDLRRIEDGARSPSAPKALRDLQKRIDKGELSWRDIVAGEHMDHPAVREAALDNLAKLRRVYGKIKEGYSLNEVLDSERPAGSKGRTWRS